MNDKTALVGEIESQIMVTSFLGTVSLFFTGILIAQLHQFDQSIKVPILFLIIATFSFIFSASIYANASSELSRHEPKKAHRYVVMANNISEFLGLYLFIIAIPLVLNSITTDSLLRIAVPAVALVGLLLYSLSPFSILDKEASTAENLLITILFCGLGLLVNLSQLGFVGGYNILAPVLIVFVFALTVYYLRNTKQLDKVEV